MDPLNLQLNLNILNNLEAAEIANHPRQQFQRNIDPINSLSDYMFIKQFRLSKELVLRLVEMLDNFLTPPTRISSVGKLNKVLIALNFFATGSYQRSVGSNIHCSGVSQSTVSKCVDEVVNALNNPIIFNEWVKFPNNLEELETIRRRFFGKYSIPGIVGVIDCTHVAIFPPLVNDDLYPEHIYINRKQYHSLNVQLICDDKLKILNVNARFPGSTHDSYIWNNSAISTEMINLSRRYEGFYLIGDSGYALRTWLQTPIRYAVHGTAEHAYNEAFKQARSLIERTNGLLKMRFRCLLKHRVLHYHPTKASLIVNACVVLHNLCVVHNIQEPEDAAVEEDDLGIFEGDHNVPAEGRNPDLYAAQQLQNRIVQNYFREHKNHVFFQFMIVLDCSKI